MALAAFTVSASEYERDGGESDWMCCADKACTTIISPHADAVRARDACGKLTDADGTQRWTRSNAFRITASAPPPPVCPPQPANETQPGTCPAGTSGTWTQTQTYASAPPPQCWTPSGFLPTSPPPGACVAPPPVNNPPTISGTPSAAVVAGTAYSFTPVGADPDGGTLAFTIQNKPSWAAFSTATGALTGTPSSANVGVHSSIRITVSDGNASASTSAFSITVTAAPPPPGNTPTNLTATVAVSPTDSALRDVTLTWTGVANATMYEIDRCTGAGCTGFQWFVDVPGSPYKHLNQPAGQTYRYRVRTWTPSPPGPYSTPVQVTTTVTTPPPPPPSGVAALQWSPPQKNTDGSTLSNLAGYTILYGLSPTQLTNTVQINSAGVTAYSVTNLAAGTWSFAVRARNSQGAESINSNIASKVVQ
jgi:hypothetical protein